MAFSSICSFFDFTLCNILSSQCFFTKETKQIHRSELKEEEGFADTVKRKYVKSFQMS